MLRVFLLAEQIPVSTFKQRCHIYQQNKIEWSQKNIAAEIGVESAVF